MKLYQLFSLLAIVLISFQATSQSMNGIEVYDVAEEQSRIKFKALDLDKDHPNLLNPEISKNEINKVRGSWTQLHQDIGKYLEDKGFQWEVDDPEIMILHKFYFEPNGKIKTYFFRIYNEGVSEAQRETYSKLITEFAKTHSIGITKDSPFAQCGKSKYVNP